MKTLYFFRHAGSEHEGNMQIADIKRPLNPHGHAIAAKQGMRLRTREIVPEHIISSHEQRAIESAETIAEELEFPRTEIEVQEGLYASRPEDILEIIRNTDDGLSSLMVLGYKTTFTDMIGFISGDEMDDLDEGSIACVEINVESWKEVGEGLGEIKFIIDPDDDFPESHSQDLLNPEMD
jgi:phosphohistidine phosphatase